MKAGTAQKISNAILSGAAGVASFLFSLIALLYLTEFDQKIVAALVAGTVFGLLHAFTGISAVPPLITLGFIFCLLYEKTGSIVPGILLHMLNNSVALLAQ